MAITLTKSGIVNNTTIQAWHVTQSVNALTGLVAYDITISGSLTVKALQEANSRIDKLEKTIEELKNK